jgi:hypothetical protein
MSAAATTSALVLIALLSFFAFGTLLVGVRAGFS